ncbi:hypothetical protein [Corynebacterium glyciniphilum]|uniref:hypothetical protein n=1 Tax=Corynebacterium glyciniphilum TaxID=1404244 RepID=UPI003FD0C8E2
MTATAVKPDPNVYPVHSVGTWEHALTCQVAGVPVPPESLQVLAAHDRHRSPTGRDLLKLGEVVALDDLVQRITRRAWTRDSAEVQGALLAITPIGGAIGEDEAHPYTPASGAGTLHRTYLDPELFTVSGHYVARGPVALQKFRAEHLRPGRMDPMAPPTETAPEPAPEPVVPVPQSEVDLVVAPEPAPEPAVPVPDALTTRVRRSARRVLRDMPRLAVQDLAVEVWVDLDGDVEESDIVTALETLGYTDEPADERTAA